MNTNRANLSYKNGPKREIKHNGTESGPKWQRSLQQSWRGAQNRSLYSLHQAMKIITNKANLSCKKRPRRVVKRQVLAFVLKQRRALQKCWREAQKKMFHSLCQGPKQLTNRPKILCKNWPKREKKKQVIAGGLILSIAFHECYRVSQIMLFYSLCPSPKHL